MTTGTLSEYAAHIGTSPAYVTKLKQRGRLVFRGDGEKQVVDFDLSDRMVRNTTDMSRSGSGKNARQDGTSSAAIAPVASGDRVDIIFRKAQAQERVFESKKSEIEYRKMAGELIEVAAIRSELGGLLASLREALMQIPARLAPVLAAESDATKVQDSIADEIHQSLEQLTARHAQMEAA